jgi:hypothetical protein
MSTDTTDPRQQLAELEQRVIDGDSTVTPSAIQKARAAAEFADLLDEAAQRRANDQAVTARQAIEDAFRAELTTQAARLPSIQTAYANAVTALRALSEGITGWQDTRRTLEHKAKALGLTDDLDAALVSLHGRDWIATAYDEARGKYQRGQANRRHEGGLHTAPIRFHVLHDTKTRERITRDDDARAEARAEAHREREERKQLEREADRVA